MAVPEGPFVCHKNMQGRTNYIDITYLQTYLLAYKRLIQPCNSPVLAKIK